MTQQILQLDRDIEELAIYYEIYDLGKFQKTQAAIK